VARLGGDEFTVLMPALGHTDDVGTVLRKILGVFETPFMLDDAVVEATTSIGICMFPDDGECGEELMKKADIAMYAAKGSGKNSYQFYNAEINSRTIKRQKMESLLHQAVGRGEMELLFQPQVCSNTRGIIGAEALLRWRHPEQGLLTPDQFLAVAEDSGAIVPIGEWVIRNACDQARIWNEKGYPLSVSVNLSNRQFHQPNFIEKTALILAETGLMPHQLEFDITEKTIMTDVDFSLRSMQVLAEMGVALAIDNFGSGSSSLHWIKKMRTHKVKIDKSFVINMMCEPDDLAVVNAVIAMSHNLNMKVAANGVETEEQLSVIQQSGCDQLQGYVISKPLQSVEFEQMVVNY
jgi:predicted signal transduction protein with EAL and GGDEF domain